MAIYYLNIKQISRRDGSRATSAAAYRSGTAITDERSGRTFNHSARQDVEHKEILLPGAAGGEPLHWARDRAQLWNRAEAAETRGNARVAREYALALPHELNPAQRLSLAREFAGYIAERYKVAVDLTIHQPRALGDPRNYHAHLLTTTREVTATGLGAKSAAEITNSLRAERGLPQPWQDFREVRQRWAEMANEALHAIGSQARIDARSLAAQGIERRPTTHLGLAVTSMQRRGIQTEVLKRVTAEQEQEQSRLRHQQIAAAPSRADCPQSPWLRPAPDPSGYLPYSLHATGRGGGFASIEAERRAGAAQWLEGRSRELDRGAANPAGRSPTEAGLAATALAGWQTGGPRQPGGVTAGAPDSPRPGRSASLDLYPEPVGPPVRQHEGFEL
jgi:hypothetical protein